MRVAKNSGKRLRRVIPKRSLAGPSKSIVGSNTRKGNLTHMAGVDTKAPKAQIGQRKDYSKIDADPFAYASFGFGETGRTGES